MIATKSARLLELMGPNRDLLMFGPESARKECPPGVAYHAIESVFAAIDATAEGRWLIDRMLLLGAS